MLNNYLTFNRMGYPIQIDLLKIIIQYAGKREIILLQDLCPELLKYVIVYDLDGINKDNYKYIQQMCPTNNVTDDDLKYLTNMTSLNLSYNNKITDKGIQNMTKMTNLNLSYNNKITD